MTIEQVLRFGLRQRGVPYQWGGTTRAGGFDCSGLVYAAYRRAGYSGIGRTTYDQIRQGTAVGRNQLVPGDIVFPEASHEGLYIGNGMVLEAPHTGGHVQVVPLAEFGFLTARRLVHGGGGIVPPRGIGGVGPSGLPIPSANPGDRLPHPTAGRAAALALLLGLHSPQAAPTSFHPVSPGNVLHNLDQQPQVPGAPQQQPGLAGYLTPSGQTTGQLQSSLDATRQSLLKV